MYWLKRSFRVLKIRDLAKEIAKKVGRSSAGGWIYDDDEMRIVVDASATIIFIANEHGDRKLVFSDTGGLRGIIYYEGDWERYFARIYKTAKTRS